MKLFNFVLVLATAVAAHAADPKVGSLAKFDVELSKGDKKVAGALTLELLQYNAKDKKWLQKQTFQAATQPAKSDEAWVDEASLLTDAVIDQILADCAAEGGVLEKVKVPAGEFNSCAIAYDEAEESGKIWLAKSSFGLVKQDSLEKASQVRTVLQLKEQK